MELNQNHIDQLVSLSVNAGERILEVYNTDFDVEIKSDSSPLTIADQKSNDEIVAGLTKYFPEIPFISEETKAASFAERSAWEYAWLIDPLDGTKEFVKRNGEFTVNIALLHRGKAVFGVIHVPVTGVTYYALEGRGAFKIENGLTSMMSCRSGKERELIKVVASRSHLSPEVEAYVQALKDDGKDVEYVAAGSSLKFCLVAEGSADVYPRLGPTMEWDTAAGHVIAEQAGAQVFRHDNNKSLLYNKEDLLNPYFIVTTLES